MLLIIHHKPCGSSWSKNKWFITFSNKTLYNLFEIESGSIQNDQRSKKNYFLFDKIVLLLLLGIFFF